ncbi:MAG: TetR/AcrR family transcriptional regulator [Eubacteriales bacterium]|nr:TetR/AcrR family transcriptional regulator [Eubacteriales bacterium]
MAHKNHELDGRIIDAAFSEFLKKGYRDASLRKIAEKAGATVGAIRTRYRTKDALFCGLIEPFVSEIEAVFQSIKAEYFQNITDDVVAHLEKSMRLESKTILHVIFDHYDEAVLLLCRSGGSSLEGFFDEIIERKVCESAAFFRGRKEGYFDQNLLQLLISSQFYSYFQIVNNGYGKDAAERYMNAVMQYHFGGWMALLNLREKPDGDDDL